MADKLRGAGIAAGSRVALLLQHDAPMVAATLACLRLGLTYVPLHTDIPPTLLKKILDHSSVEYVIIESATEYHAVYTQLKTDNIKIVLLNSLEDVCNVDRSNRRADCLRSGYVAYTSGTTATPKGVVQSYIGLSRNIARYARSVPIDSDDTVGCLAHFSTDAGLMDIFAGLTAGARVALINLSDTTAGSLSRLAQVVQSSELTVLHATPTLFRIICAQIPKSGILTSVKVVVLGGEEARLGDLDLFHRFFPNSAVLINGYGPTETTIAFQCRFGHADKPECKSLPIGFPVEGTEYFLREINGSTERGVAELAITSDGVACGYLGEPELSSEKFRELWDGRRTFFTGDLVKTNDDGSLTWVGRVDRQLKIRGHRIEPGEIESLLRDHPRILDAAVTLEKKIGEAAQLVAYYVPAGIGQSINQLRSDLAQHIERKLLPNKFVPVSYIPLKVNGKADCTQLAQLSSSNVTGTTQRDIYGCQAEVLQIWSDIMPEEIIELDTNVLKLGADSLTFVEASLAIEERFGVAISLETMLSFGSLLEQADYIASTPLGLESFEDKFEEVDRSCGASGVNRAQERYIARIMAGASSAQFNVVRRAVVAGPFDTHAFNAAVNHVISSHPGLRAQFFISGKAANGRIISIEDFHFTLSHCDYSNRSFSAAEFEKKVMCKNLDIFSDPLIEVCVVRLDETKHIIYFLWSHLIVDGMSRQIFEKHLSEVYRSLTFHGNELSDNEFEIGSSSSYSRISVGKFSGHDDRDLSFWRSRLTGLRPVPHSSLCGPGNYVRSGRKCIKASALQWRTTGKVGVRLKDFCARMRSTPFCVLLTCFFVSLSHFTKSADLCVTTNESGRQLRGASGAIGMFANVLPIRANILGENSFEQLLAFIGQCISDAITHNSIPFSDLIECTFPQFAQSYDDLFQFAFTLNQVSNLEFVGATACSVADLPLPYISRPVIFVAEPKGNEIEFSMAYRTSVVSGSRAAEFKVAMDCVLNEVLQGDRIAIGEIWAYIAEQVATGQENESNQVDNGHEYSGLPEYYPEVKPASNKNVPRRQ